MKQKLLLILAAVFATATTAWADNSCGDGVTWSYDTNTKTLTISKTGDGSGDMANYYQLEQESYVNGDNQPWKSYNEEIEEIVIEDGVTSIGYFAFYGCTAVESVTIANSVY